MTLLRIATAALVLAGALVVGTNAAPQKTTSPDATFICFAPQAIDGDTLKCGATPNRFSVRLTGIDAPEMRGHCRTGRTCVSGDPIAARDALSLALLVDPISVEPLQVDLYGRLIGRVVSGSGVNISCALVRGGFAKPKPTWDPRRGARRDCPDLIK